MAHLRLVRHRHSAGTAALFSAASISSATGFSCSRPTARSCRPRSSASSRIPLDRSQAGRNHDEGFAVEWPCDSSWADAERRRAMDRHRGRACLRRADPVCNALPPNDGRRLEDRITGIIRGVMRDAESLGVRTRRRRVGPMRATASPRTRIGSRPLGVIVSGEQAGCRRRSGGSRPSSPGCASPPCPPGLRGRGCGSRGCSGRRSHPATSDRPGSSAPCCRRGNPAGRRHPARRVTPSLGKH